MLLHFGLQNVIHSALLDDFLAYRFDIENYIGKYPKKCKNKPKRYPLKVGIRTCLAPKIGTLGLNPHWASPGPQNDQI